MGFEESEVAGMEVEAAQKKLNPCQRMLGEMTAAGSSKGAMSGENKSKAESGNDQNPTSMKNCGD